MGQGESAIKGFVGSSFVKFGGGMTDQAKASAQKNCQKQQQYFHHWKQS